MPYTQYTLGNKCAKNGCKQTILVQLIILDTVYSCFWKWGLWDVAFCFRQICYHTVTLKASCIQKFAIIDQYVIYHAIYTVSQKIKPLDVW